MTIAAIVAEHGILKHGDEGEPVKTAQAALSAAGYRLNPDGEFGDATEHAVQQFQKQHGLTVDGEIGEETAAKLDLPAPQLVSMARPLLDPTGRWPHDDTASLLSFYGQPWKTSGLIVHVPVPFEMTYRQDNGILLPVRSIAFHRRAADALEQALQKIATVARTDASVLDHVGHFSGSFNYRPVRGSSRLSCHAFAAAIDFDAEHLPMNVRVKDGVVHPAVVEAFDEVGFFWGNRYKDRPDAMHWQAAHE